jgi:hypothetical protein
MLTGEQNADENNEISFDVVIACPTHYHIHQIYKGTVNG